MPEARRFLRFVLPGLTFIILICVYFGIPFFRGDIIENPLKKILEIDFNKNVFAIFAILLFLSGGFGYILSLIYYSFSEFNCFKCLIRRVNHANIIKCLQEKNCIQFIDRKGHVISTPQPNRKKAWTILLVLWHTNLNSCSGIMASNPRIDSFSDTMHGLGATMAGCFTAFIIYLAWWLFNMTVFSSISMAIALFMLYISIINYNHVVVKFNNAVDIIFYDSITDLSKFRPPIKVLYPSNEDKMGFCGFK